MNKVLLRKTWPLTLGLAFGATAMPTQLAKTSAASILKSARRSVTKMKIPCIQIRSISNKVEKRNKENWNLGLSISNLNTEVEKIINNL